MPVPARIRAVLADRAAVAAEVERLQAELERLQTELADYQRGWAPGHFYSPIPSLERVKEREQEIFAGQPEGIPLVDLNDAGQLALFERLSRFSEEQPFPAKKVSGRRYYFENPNFTYGEALILYAMVRHLRPRRIIEIGSGYSSCAVLDTNEIFFDGSIACSFVEPYPDLLLSLLLPGDDAHLDLVREGVQTIDTEFFSSLAADDILLIDSTHVAKVDSDVNHVLFRVLPALARGVYVHFHDIQYPFEYPKEWIYQGRAWNEAYILRAFLQGSAAFEVVFFNSYFARFHRELLSTGMPLSLNGPGSSLWLRKS